MPMQRGLAAPLSPSEESALRRVGAGISALTHLPDREVSRLKRLVLVEERDGRVRLTALGRARMKSLARVI